MLGPLQMTGNHVNLVVEVGLLEISPPKNDHTVKYSCVCDFVVCFY